MQANLSGKSGIYRRLVIVRDRLGKVSSRSVNRVDGDSGHDDQNPHHTACSVAYRDDQSSRILVLEVGRAAPYPQSDSLQSPAPGDQRDAVKSNWNKEDLV